MGFITGTIPATISAFVNILGSIGGDGKLSLDDILTGDISESNLDIVIANGSMIKFLRPLVVNFPLITSSSLATNAYLKYVHRFNIELFAVFYQQVFTMLVNLNGMSARTGIDILSTTSNTRSLERFGTTSVSKRMGLLSKETVLDLNNDIPTTLAEGSFTAGGQIIKEIKLKISVTPQKGNNVINVRTEQKDFELTILVRAIPKLVPFDQIINIYEVRNGETGFLSRLDSARAGEISFKELFIPSQLLRDYKKGLLKDYSDVLKNIEKQEQDSLKLVRDGNSSTAAVGFARFYGALTITETEAQLLARMLFTKTGDRRFVDKVLTGGNKMMLNIVDADLDNMDYALIDNDFMASIRLKDLKKKKPGEDLADIMKDLMGASKAGSSIF